MRRANSPPSNQQFSQDRQPLQLSRFLFWISLILFTAGLISGFSGDLADNFNLVIASDILSFAVFLICFLLVWLRKINAGTGLLICATEALRNMYVALLIMGSVNPNYAYANDDIMKLLLITCLFAAVLGLSVNKYVAVAYNVGGIIMQFVYVFLFRDDHYFQEQFAVNCVIMTGSLSVIFYYRTMLEKIFSDLTSSLGTTRIYQEQVESLNEQNRPFVVFGRNTAGLVHDFRNDINSIDMTIQTMNLRYSRGKLPNLDDFDAIERSLANFNRRIDKVKFLTSATADREPEILNLERVLESALYPFTISQELRQRFSFETSIRGDVYILGYRLQYLQIIENIIRNSCEAIVSRHSDEPLEFQGELLGNREAWGEVGVQLIGDADKISFIFSDNGPGIDFCKSQNQHLDCMDCPCFVIGRSTKSYGSGFGMVNIIKAVREMGGTLSIKTGDAGTRISVVIPRPLQIS